MTAATALLAGCSGGTDDASPTSTQTTSISTDASGPSSPSDAGSGAPSSSETSAPADVQVTAADADDEVVTLTPSDEAARLLALDLTAEPVIGPSLLPGTQTRVRVPAGNQDLHMVCTGTAS